MPHPGNDGGFGTLFDGDSLRPGDGAASDRGGVIGHGTGQPVGEISVCRMEGEERQHRSIEILDVFGLSFVSASGVGVFAFGVPLGGSLASSSARILSMVAAGAQTPREKTFRPFFSWTTQCSPAAFTLRVRAASPGGRSTQPSGAVRTFPSADRTVFGVGPGVKVVVAHFRSPTHAIRSNRRKRQSFSERSRNRKRLPPFLRNV